MAQVANFFDVMNLNALLTRQGIAAEVHLRDCLLYTSDAADD